MRQAREMAGGHQPGRRRARRAGARAGARRRHLVERIRDRPVHRAAGRQGRAAGRVEPAPRGARGRLAHVGLAARRVGADLPGRPERDAGHAAPGAPAGPARGAGAVGQRLRDDAHAGAARRAGLGVPDRSARRPAAGTGTPSWRSCPSCWPRSSAPRRWRPGPTTWWSTRPTCGSRSTSRSGMPPSSTGPSATRRPTPAPPSPPSTSSARWPTAPPSCTSPATARCEHGLATVGIDDEGVEAQSFDLVRDGTLVGYQLDRSIAAAMGFDRSNGCAFADSPMHVPIQRMANVSLAHAGRGRPEHRGADRRRRAGRLHRGRQELVDRHAALQLPVHRAALLPD